MAVMLEGINQIHDVDEFSFDVKRKEFLACISPLTRVN